MTSKPTLQEQLEIHRQKITELEDQIVREATEALSAKIDEAITEAQQIRQNGSDIHKDAQDSVNELIKLVFGKEYKARKKPTQPYNWENLIRELVSAGISSAKKGLTKAEMEEFAKSNELGFPTLAQWNKGKSYKFRSTGSGTHTKYYV